MGSGKWEVESGKILDQRMIRENPSSFLGPIDRGLCPSTKEEEQRINSRKQTNKK